MKSICSHNIQNLIEAISGVSEAKKQRSDLKLNL